MKSKISIILAFLIPALSLAQAPESFKEGFFIDKNGQKFSGFLLLEPGDGKTSSSLVFRENRKSKKETYQPGYIESFMIEKDSFAVIKNVPMPNRKTLPMDFARVVVAGTGGVLYLQELSVNKSSGHAHAEFNVEKEKLRYLIFTNNKFTSLTAGNMSALAPVVADHEDLKKRLASKKVKFTQLSSVVEEYNAFRKKPKS